MKEMNEIRLNKLSLRDFQGGTITFDAKGKDVFIFGANAVGKTRLVSAFTWLLFDKDALGRADFQLKNLNARGEATHNLEHTVTADLDVNGEIVNLKKVFKEKWTKKRGNAEREFSGHTTEYAVNGVPIQEKDYISRIAEIASDESHFRLLTSPMTFPALHWQKQRTLLLEICGDISDADVIASNEKLFPLPAILGKRTLDDHRKVVMARRSEINKEMEKIPVRIDEVRRGFPDISGLDLKICKQEVASLEITLNDAKLRLQGVDSGGAIADLSKKLQGLNADLRKTEDAHRSESLSILNRLNQQISETETWVNVSRRRTNAIEGELKGKNGSLESTEATLVRAREKWISIDEETLRDTVVDTCPACGQSLPTERVQDAREKALASFNSSKAERLKETNDKGMSLKEQKERLTGEIDALKMEKKILDENITVTESELKRVIEDRNDLKHSSEDFSAIPNRADLLDEIEDLESQIKAERENKVQDKEKIRLEIFSHESNLNYAKAKVDMFTRREQGERRIEELLSQEKQLAKEFEKLEGELYLIEQFIKAKVAMLTDRINGKFEMVRFKLFDVQVNGGISDCCEITVNGIPFNGGLNSGARTQSGCDIIRTLQQHFGMKAPVFCDNRESVTDLPRLSCQMISLVVSPEDKVLRVEVA